MSGRIIWAPVLEEAAQIVRSYDTPVTLRQLFYRLVASERLPNTRSYYTQLSSRTAEARRRGKFPDLIDETRSIHRHQTFENPTTAADWLCRIYRRDRTEGQSVSLYLGVEKRGIVQQLDAWFSHMGIPILALGGYSSQSYVDEVTLDVGRQDRPGVLIYAGDFDPSGVDIDRDFVERGSAKGERRFDEVHRIALNWEQVETHGLPPQMGKATDSRAAAFEKQHGRLVQVELDALPPDVLHSLYEVAIGPHFDLSTFREVVHQESQERLELKTSLGGG